MIMEAVIAIAHRARTSKVKLYENSDLKIFFGLWQRWTGAVDWLSVHSG
jgi:hypothetical protein